MNKLLLIGLVLASNAFAQEYIYLTETSHFEIKIKNSLSITREEKEQLSSTLEDGYKRVLNALSRYAIPPQKLEVLLAGEGLPENSAPNYPNVDDSTGVITLYRFPGLGEAYLQGLPHELVHAFRIDLIRRHQAIGDFNKGYLFVEEAFSEYLATKVAPDNISFPRYGFPLEVVAGYWLIRKMEIPIEALFENHQINGTCIAQAYPLRASFFSYLASSYGEVKVFELSYDNEEISKKSFNKIFGKDLPTLVQEWRNWATAQLMSYPNYKENLKKYCETDMPYFPVCSENQGWTDPSVSYGNSDSKIRCSEAIDRLVNKISH
jgi:hypothetical protein